MGSKWSKVFEIKMDCRNSMYNFNLTLKNGTFLYSLGATEQLKSGTVSHSQRAMYGYVRYNPDAFSLPKLQNWKIGVRSKTPFWTHGSVDFLFHILQLIIKKCHI